MARKTSLNKWIRAASNFIPLIFVKWWEMFLELNSKVLYQSLWNEKKFVVLYSLPRRNVNSGHFHVVVIQRRQRNVQNSVMHVCKFVMLIKTYRFLPFWLTSPANARLIWVSLSRCLYFQCPPKVIIILTELMFLSINLVWALLIVSITSRGSKTYFCPRTLTLLFYCNTIFDL